MRGGNPGEKLNIKEVAAALSLIGSEMCSCQGGRQSNYW